ncbi:MAG: LTA synthase family protein [Rudaea sp.]
MFALLGRWQPTTMKYIHYELLQNLLSLNLDLGISRPYSNAFVERITKEYVAPSSMCEPGQAKHPNIIILAVESLSLHQSLLFGGFRDLTPHLDAIARSHAYFPGFIANGFSTEGGMIAILTGHLPVMGRYQSPNTFLEYSEPHGSMPDLLRASGYSTHFFTTGDLGFLNNAQWLKNIGFDTWEGAEAPFYQGWKRRHFGAAEDKALYLRFLQWFNQHDQTQPFMSFLMTLSTHPPFIDPRSDTPSEEGVFQYADEQIGMFYSELQKRDFFHNGVLLISGDHRSMTPIMAAELKRFGDTALARTPLVVATDLPLAHGEVHGAFQQTDILPSLADLIQKDSCHSPAQGLFLRQKPVPPTYSLHVRGDKRDQIDVFFDDQQGEVILDGDNSHWLGPKPADWQQIMDGILLDRIARQNAPAPKSQTATVE